MRIMVVDDSLTMRRIIAVNLKKAGYADIVEAETGMDALLKLDAGEKVDVILLDWNMPEMTGIDFLKNIKSNAKYKGIPVIMITTEAEKEHVMHALQSGASGYLVKPITPETFQKQVVEKLKVK